MTSCLLIRWNYFQIVLLSCQGVEIVCLNLQEYRRYLDEYNVYSVLTVQTKLHTTLDKTSTDRTRSCVPADVDVLGKTPRITWGEPVETVEGEVIEGVAEADDVQAVVLVDSSIGGEEIQLVEHHAKVVHVQYLWELLTILGLCQSDHCNDVEFLLSWSEW